MASIPKMATQKILYTSDAQSKREMLKESPAAVLMLMTSKPVPYKRIINLNDFCNLIN